MTENLIERFAGYPKDEDAATAENVYRHLLVSAQVAHLRWQELATKRHETSPDDPDYADKITTYMAGAELFVSHWSTLHLLRHVMGLQSDWVDVDSGLLARDVPPTADDLARAMWIGWEDGGGPAEVLWDWLIEAGIAPEEIETEFAKTAAKESPA